MIPFVLLSLVQGRFKCFQAYQPLPVPPAKCLTLTLFISSLLLSILEMQCRWFRCSPCSISRSFHCSNKTNFCDFCKPDLLWGKSHLFSLFLWPVSWFPVAQMQCLHQSLGQSVLYPQLSSDAVSKLPAGTRLSQVNKYSREQWKKRQWKIVLISNVVSSSWLSDRLSDFLCHAPPGTCCHSLPFHFSETWVSQPKVAPSWAGFPSWHILVVLRSIYLMIS